MGFRVVLYGYGKSRHHGDSIPRPSNPQQVTATMLCRSTLGRCSNTKSKVDQKVMPTCLLSYVYNEFKVETSILEFEIRIIILYCLNSVYYVFYNLFHILITEVCNVFVQAISSVVKMLCYVFLISPMHLRFQCGWFMVILYTHTLLLNL